jgi:hypothetical protein
MGILTEKLKTLRMALVFLFLFGLSFSGYQWWLLSRPTTLYALRTKKEWMLGKRFGRESDLTLLASDTLKDQTSFEVKAMKEGFHLVAMNSFAEPGFQADPFNVEGKNKVLVKEGRRFFILDQYPKFKESSSAKIPIDILIVRNAGIKSLENALVALEPKEIWVDWSEKAEASWNRNRNAAKVLNFRHVRYREI